MTGLVRATLTAVALLVVGTPLTAQQPSIVYLDSERLRREAPGLQQAGQEIQQELGKLEVKADSALAPLQQELQQLQTQLRQQQGPMTTQSRQEQQQAIQRKQIELQQAGSQWEQRAAALQNQILGPALQRINEVINGLREERGYAFILDSGAGGVVAADPSLDITDEVLRRLNQGASSGS